MAAWYYLSMTTNQSMIDPKPYIAFVEALNAIEPVVKAANRYGIRVSTEIDLYHYSVEFDSEAERWTLVSETDEAPNLCSFNQTEDECKEIDPCEQCMQVQDRLAAEYDSTVSDAWRSR